MEKKIITGDEPSMPRDGVFDKDFLGRGSATGYRVEPQTGLTIRQHFAAMALASGSSPDASVKKADELIKLLNEVK